MRSFAFLPFLVLGACVTDDVQTVTRTACGTTVTMHVGEQLAVSLDSTYWMLDPGLYNMVLEQDGATTTTPSGNCAPGVGCGTMRAEFTALNAGVTRIAASRTSCGEALGCGPGQGDGVCSFMVGVTQH